MKVVLDASFVLAWNLKDEKFTQSACALRDKFLPYAESLHAPANWSVEVLSGLQTALARKRTTKDEVTSILKDLQDLRVVLAPPISPYTLIEHWQFSSAHKLSPYDAGYLRLAMDLRAEFGACILLSADKHLRRAANDEHLLDEA